MLCVSLLCPSNPINREENRVAGTICLQSKWAAAVAISMTWDWEENRPENASPESESEATLIYLSCFKWRLFNQRCETNHEDIGHSTRNRWIYIIMYMPLYQHLHMCPSLLFILSLWTQQIKHENCKGNFGFLFICGFELPNDWIQVDNSNGRNTHCRVSTTSKFHCQVGICQRGALEGMKVTGNWFTDRN